MRTLTDRQLKDFYALSATMPVAAGRADGQTQSTRVLTSVPCFPYGQVDHPEYGTLTFDNKTLRQYVRNFENRTRKIDICLDVDHKNEAAAGWVKRLSYHPGDGVYADVELNRMGQELVADRRYRYLSPQFGSYTDEETGETTDNVLIALTLTNFPFLKSMPSIPLSERGRRATLPEFIRPTQGRRAGYIIDNPDFHPTPPRKTPYSPSMKKTKDKRCRSGCAMCALSGRKELIS